MASPHRAPAATRAPVATSASTCSPLDTPFDEQNGLSRRTVLAGLAAACGTAILVLNRPARALSAVNHNDAQLLRFLEEVEQMQADFFNRAAQSAAFEGMEQRERDIFSLIAEQDRKHAKWFQLARQKFNVAEFGRFYTPNTSQSRPMRVFTFPATHFNTRANLLIAASALKDVSVGAYHGAVGEAGNGEIVEALAALAGIEGRHAAALRELNGTNGLDAAFEPALSAAVVAKRLKEFGFTNIPLM